MSKDIQIAWPCPHLTIEEKVSLGADRMSLQTRQPVGAAGTVRILVNNEIYIPQMGLHPSRTLGCSFRLVMMSWQGRIP